jgi:CheY-like chemotaxis protein
MGVLNANCMVERNLVSGHRMQQAHDTRQSRVLLVEDDDDTRRVYAIMLRYSDFAVIEAATGREAVDRAASERPDLILMDMGLPTFDGWEAARQIRLNPRAATIPMVAFSALVESIADLRRDSVLFDGFISKPVSPSELVRRVTAYFSLLGPA